MDSHEQQNLQTPDETDDIVITSVRQKSDIAWQYVILTEEGQNQCMFCKKIIQGGGIHRMKEHLAKKKGAVRPCLKVPNHVQYQMISNLDEYKKEKRKRTTSTENSFSVSMNESEINPKGVGSSQKSIPTGDSYFPSGSTPGSQPGIKSVLQQKEDIEKVDMLIAAWMYEADIPFNAISLPSFQKMLDGVASIGLGYKAPTAYAVREPLLNKTFLEVKEYVETHRKVWKMNGCTIMADGWTDRRQRTLINFLVYSVGGTVFLKSVDASEYSKTAEKLFELFKDCVEFVGHENVVHFVTDNAANYQAAGKMITRHYANIFWSPCSAHCLDLILEKFDQVPQVEFVIEDARKITKFIYNHGFVLHLMRKFCKSEIIRPAATRFATNFLTIQSLLEKKEGLVSMIVSKEWSDHKISKTIMGKELYDRILSNAFWNSRSMVVGVAEPIVKVLRLVDSDERPSMGYIQEGMRRAREAIKMVFNGIESEYKPYINIFDDKWDKQLGHPLHKAGFLLNPSFFYKDDRISLNHHIMAGFHDTLETLFNNQEDKVDRINAEFSHYRDAIGDFGRPSTIRNREKMTPVEWWKMYGGSTPGLQELAIRVLGQTCSASACERNWSIFERIHAKKRNKLCHKRLNALVFVHANRRLKRKSDKKDLPDPISLEAMELYGDWVEEPEVLHVEGEMEAWINDDDDWIGNMLGIHTDA